MSAASVDEIRREVRAVIRTLAPNPDRTQDDARLVEDLEYHSLALLELAFALEDEYDLPPISHDDAMLLTTVAKVEDFVVSRKLQR
jgi:acyl carrier protein